MLFGRFLKKGYPISTFANNSSSAGISSDDLLDLILHYWLEKPFFYTKSEGAIEDMTKLDTLIQHLCEVADDRVTHSYNAISPWWQRIREPPLKSPSALRGPPTAIVCRNLSGVYRKKMIQHPMILQLQPIRKYGKRCHKKLHHGVSDYKIR